MPTEIKIPPAKVARIVERFRHHLYRLHQRSAPAVAVMFELVTGAWVAQAVQVAAELGIADALSEQIHCPWMIWQTESARTPMLSGD